MARRRAGVSIVASLGWIFLLYSAPSAAQVERCSPGLGRIVSLQGDVEVEAAAKRVPAELEMRLCLGDAVHVGPLSRAAVQLLDAETVLRLDQNTTSRFDAPATAERSFLQLLGGAVHFLSRVPRALEVRTPYVNAGIEGTEFLVAVDAARRQTRIVVYEGQVSAENAQGKLLLRQYQSAVAGAYQAPTLETVVRSRDAVNWTLYYQPVLAALAMPGAGVPAVTATTQRLQAALATGGVAAALAVLDGLSPSLRDERTEVWRAALLMQVGRWQEARKTLEGLLRAGSAGAEARALLSVLYVTQNERTRALAEAMKAIDLDPDSAAAYMALSYAQQAGFDLEAARQSLLKAVEVAPGDALAWARLSELWLAGGYRDRALEAAEKAVALSPEAARAHSVLGFAALARIDLDAATAEFGKAIQFASDDPLPRFGLGLAKIRDGHLVEGRREIEVAAALASNSALLRSYLGKAYFEEKRAPLDARQFELAQQLDPNDPTAFFYDAIRLQSENRPVEALRQIERAIALNDNRAVYRSRQLLDEDRAVRGTSLGRIYQDLGFERLAVLEGTRSLGYDPANYSAHRFLADSYALRDRHEIARASELLQAQLLQPLNNEPVQPRLSQTDLNIPTGAGPAEAAFNEFTSLFERDDIRFTASGLIGNLETRADEATLSGVQDRFSYSLGQFHYESDGFRSNNDQQHDLYNGFAQAALTDILNVQLELRRRKTDKGDLSLSFLPSATTDTARTTIDQDTARIGVHYTPRPELDLLGSLIYSARDGQFSADVGGPVVTDQDDIDGTDAQIQAIYRQEHWNVVVGGGLYDLKNRSHDIIDFTPFPVCPFPLPVCILELKSKSDITQSNVYGYLNVNYPDPIIWTAGLSYESYDDENIKKDEVNPKFGIQWDVTDRVRFRASAYRTLKRQLLVNQTLEPTSVSGFNQFFDDTNATVAESYGVGLDAQVRKDLYVGLEGTLRDLEVSFFDAGTNSIDTEDQSEKTASAYVYWMPGDSWAIRMALEYENFDRPRNARALPSRIENFSVPIAIRYFSSMGLFGEIGLRYVNQHVELPMNESGKDDFVLADLALGYRFPQRRGLLSLEVRNLFDEDFSFQDSTVQSNETKTPRFLPARTIFVRLTLSF